MNYFPNIFTKKAVGLFLFLLVIISILKPNKILPIIWIIFGIITVFLFFNTCNKLTIKTLNYPEKVFLKKILIIAFVIRVIWVFFSYFFYINQTGAPFEFSAADAAGYHYEATWIKQLFLSGNYSFILNYYSTRLSDAGYPIYLTFMYYFFNDSIIIARIIKALLSSITVFLIYKLTKRSFNIEIAKIAAIIAAIYPNLIYYTGLHVKETEMTFLFILLLERADYLLRIRRFSFKLITIVFILGISLYFFRAVLAYSVFIVLAISSVLSSTMIFKGKRYLQFFLISGLIILLFIGGETISEVVKFWGDRTSNQELSLNQRTNLNKFAKYGSAAIFAPIIIVAPIPTLINIPYQQNQMLIGGANYVKNIMSFFTILSIVLIIKNKKVRSHILLLSMLAAYLAILAMSKFALVERFHLLILPLHIILMSYGINQLNRKNLVYFNSYIVVISLIIIGWNWFKLAGRGEF